MSMGGCDHLPSGGPMVVSDLNLFKKIHTKISTKWTIFEGCIQTKY